MLFIPSGETDDTAAILLGGAAGARWRVEAPQAALFGEYLASLAAFSSLLVQQDRFPRRTAPVAQGLDHDGVLVGTTLNAQDFAGAYGASGLGALAAGMDLAASDRFSRQRARLEEPCGPQPFIEPDPVLNRFNVHRSRLGSQCQTGIPNAGERAARHRAG